MSSTMSENINKDESNDVGDVSESLPGTSRNDMTSNAATLQTSSTKSYLTHYNMNHSKRGIAVIFSNESDTPSKSCNEENIDNEKLNETLSYLGFDVWLYHNFTLDDIVTTLKKVANEDHSESDCLIVFVLIYGEHDYLYAYKTCYRADFLCNHFIAEKCPTLAGKPKLFFIQTFQFDNNNLLEKIEINELSDASRVEADFLIVHSTITDICFWSKIRQTLFIRILCFQLRENGTRYDLLTLLTLVCQHITKFVVIGKLLYATFTNEKIQIPCIISMLTRLVQFTSK